MDSGRTLPIEVQLHPSVENVPGIKRTNKDVSTHVKGKKAELDSKIVNQNILVMTVLHWILVIFFGLPIAIVVLYGFIVLWLSIIDGIFGTSLTWDFRDRFES